MAASIEELETRIEQLEGQLVFAARAISFIAQGFGS